MMIFDSVMLVVDFSCIVIVEFMVGVSWVVDRDMVRVGLLVVLVGEGLMIVICVVLVIELLVVVMVIVCLDWLELMWMELVMMLVVLVLLVLVEISVLELIEIDMGIFVMVLCLVLMV